jgi:hypothetical protein
LWGWRGERWREGGDAKTARARHALPNGTFCANAPVASEGSSEASCASSEVSSVKISHASVISAIEIMFITACSADFESRMAQEREGERKF